MLLYSVDVKDELYLHELGTGKRVKRLGEALLGSVDQIAGRRKDDEFWFSMTSFTSPGTVYRYDLSQGVEAREEVYREAKVEGIKPDDFVSEQVFYESKDGTRVPMFITRPKECVPLSLFVIGGAREPFEKLTLPRTSSSLPRLPCLAASSITAPRRR